MRRLIRKTAAVTAAAVLAASALSACGGGGVSFEGGKREPLTNEEAQAEISALLKQVAVNEVENPQLDIYAAEVSEADSGKPRLPHKPDIGADAFDGPVVRVIVGPNP